MNWFEKIIYALQFEFEKPQVFGWFHLTSVAVIAAVMLLVILVRRRITRKFINVTILVAGIVLIISEVLKQCVHSMDVVDGLVEWDYAWRTFPFQFCSIPMYLYVIAGIIRKGKVNDTILCFLATFAVFGGGAVLTYPSTVMSSILYLSIHTMAWHGTLLIIGTMLLVTKTVELSFKSVLKAGIIFIIVIMLAEAMNFAWHFFGNPDRTFSMLYISPYYECDIPVLHDIKENTPYIVFLLSYFIGFIMVAFIVMGAAIGIDKLHGVYINRRRS